MKPFHALFVFLVLCGASLVAGIDSLCRTQFRAQQSVDHALAQTFGCCQTDVVDADTIRVYRSLIAMDALRDTAYLSVTICSVGDQTQPQLQAHTGLTLRRLWILSDQRASGLLALLAALWLLVSLWLVGVRPSGNPTASQNSVQLGQLCYDAASNRFSVRGRELHFTPMQQTLMQLFFQAPDHLLLQQDICDHLWPKKPDASATLYTLVRRLKPILHDAAQLRVECERGRSYQLIEDTI